MRRVCLTFILFLLIMLFFITCNKEKSNLLIMNENDIESVQITDTITNSKADESVENIGGLRIIYYATPQIK